MRLNLQLYLFVFAIMFFILGVHLFSQGMFMDGTIYASVSRNWGLFGDDFWSFKFSDTDTTAFFEHPPLVFWLQGMMFNMFGDSIYIERIYSLLMFLFSSVLIVKIWKQLTKSYDYGWMPLLLWITVGNVPWVVSNNMLENTLTVFILLSLLFYLKSRDSGRFVFIILSGISLFLGFMTKGVVSLYLWSAPLFYWLFVERKEFAKTVVDTVLMVVATVLPFMMLFYSDENARFFFEHYFNKQLIGSIENVQTVNSRFEIIWMFVQQILVPGVIIGITLMFASRKIQVKKYLVQTNVLWFTIAVSLSGILPIMISLKQRSFYIVSVYPILFIGISFLAYPIVKEFFKSINLNFKFNKYISVVLIALLTSSVIFMFLRIGRIDRDKGVVEDCKTITKIAGRGSTISICPEMYQDWGLHAYFMRYGEISLEQRENIKCDYFLEDFSRCSNIDTTNWENLSLKLNKYRLYKRIGY